MLATTTHDTKRSEDCRARINVLSELPEVWNRAVHKWRRLNARHRTRLAGGHSPDANDEYLFYQALLAAWPIEWHRQPPADIAPAFVARLTAYMEKAIKEAKRHTSWITPNAEYESGVGRFIERSLTERAAPGFFESFVPFAERVAVAGMVNSLAQLVLKIASPGVADFYQGVELWDQSLVDPDNRRPVDFAHRRQLLEKLEPSLAAPHSTAVRDMIDNWPDGRIKLYISTIGMRLRRSRPRLFIDGEYHALAVEGAAADHVIAFERTHDGDTMIAIAPRLTAALGPAAGVPLGSIWGDTSLHRGGDATRIFRNLFSGARLSAGATLRVSEALQDCPVALLWAE
jgi:(1->4)-alpha-D-glucan 1-alpha-D-glucosylmutase